MVLGLDGSVSDSPGWFDRSMGSCARRVPAGGNSGNRLSMSISARLNPLSSSSSSASGSFGVSGPLGEWTLRSIEDICESVCRKVMSVGAGDGSGSGMAPFARDMLRSRLAGRLRRGAEPVDGRLAVDEALDK